LITVYVITTTYGEKFGVFLKKKQCYDRDLSDMSQISSKN
jgi:hypothetical protein